MQEENNKNQAPMRTVNGFIEIFNYIGSILISDKFIGGIGKMFKEHLEVINYAIKENETKEFWKLVGKYAAVLFSVFGVKSFFGGLLQPIIFGIIAVVSLGMIRLGRTKQAVNFEDYSKEEDEFEPIVEDTVKEEQQKPRFEFRQPSEEEDKEELQVSVTPDSLNNIRNLFSNMQSTQQQMTVDMVSGKGDLFEKAMTPEIAQSFGMNMGNGGERVENALKGLKSMQESAHKREVGINKKFMDIHGKLNSI